MPVTDKQALAELHYPGDLMADVYKLAGEGKSIRTIADTINRYLPAGFAVSRESLRRWYYSPTDTKDVA